jgi:hypothetical protein
MFASSDDAALSFDHARSASSVRFQKRHPLCQNQLPCSLQITAISETTNPIPLNKATAKKSFEKNFIGSFISNSSHVMCRSLRLEHGMGFSCGSGGLAHSLALEPVAIDLGVSGALLRR